jgi:glycosyltransferase involved in cell wall biosynthesis
MDSFPPRSSVPSVPPLTIAIPTLNRVDYLQEAIASARAQRYPNVDILISDDGHTAQTQKLVATLQKEDPRVRYVRTPGRVGLAGNWNWCADHAAGTHLLIIGDDDRLLSHCLDTLASHAASSDVIFGDHTLIDSSGRIFADASLRLSSYRRSQLRAGPVSEPEAVAWRNAIAPCAALVRTELMRRIRFDEGLNTPELEFYIRVVASGARLWFEPGVLAEYRVHNRSETARGLHYRPLLKALLKLNAATLAGKHERDRQLRITARAAFAEALGEGNGAEALAITRTGFLDSPSLRFIALLAAIVPAGLLEASVSGLRRARRLMSIRHEEPKPIP